MRRLPAMVPLIPQFEESRSGRSSRPLILLVQCRERSDDFNMSYYDHVVEAAEFLRIKLDALAPRVGIVLGTGLGAAVEAIADPVIVPYAEIPHFPQSTVEGHSGRIVAGLLDGTPVAIMQGRVHYYEGYTPAQVTFPMRVLGTLGIRAAVLTN